MNREPDARTAWRREWMPLCVVLSLAALYFLSFFNRFAGLRSGDGEFGGGIAFLAGLRPYRDYFTAGPPLNVFKSAAELGIFGKLLIVSRALAVVERLLITALLYVWLRKLFSQRAAALAAFVTIVVSVGDHTDPLASYNHDAILFAMLCGFITCCSLELTGTRRPWLLAATAGACGAFSLLTKQTVGILALFAVAVAGCIAQARMRGFGRALRWVATFLLGAAVPVAATAAYLWRLGALSACLDMMFVSGPKAKASHPFAFLAREIMIAGLFRWWFLIAIILVAVSCQAFYRRTVVAGAEPTSRKSFWAWSVAFGVTLIAAAYLIAAHATHPVQDSGKCAAYVVLFGSAIVCVMSLQTALHVGDVHLQRRAFQIVVFCFVSLAVAVSLSLSFPVFEAMVLPGLGLLLASAFDGFGPRGRIVIVSVAALLVFFQIDEKLAMPFGFDHQDEPSVRLASMIPANRMLAGMRLPATTLRFINDVQATLQNRAGKDGRLFTYPEMGLLYSLSGRYPPTRTASHNMDVVNDSFAQAEALRLLQSPPAVVVYAKPSEADMHIAELVWREGHLSGQRGIMAAVEQIVAHYDLIGTYQLAPQDTPVRIYAKPLQAPVLVGPNLPMK